VKKVHLLGVITLLLISLLTLGVGSVMAQDEVYKTIDHPLSTEEGDNVYKIPTGSVIHHFANGITEVRGPDNALVFKAIDSKTELIATPAGFLRASHVYHIPDGSSIDTKGNTDKVYLGDTRILTVIDEDRENRKSKRLLPSSPPPDYNGWIEWAEDTSVSYLDYFYAEWEVPSDPPAPNYAAINYLFPGIQPDDATAIIQPVLEWNYNSSGDWTCASWYVIGTTGYRSSDVDAEAGDEIHGTMSHDGSEWTITIDNMDDWSSSKSIDTNYFDDEGLEVYVALEGYWVQDDDDIAGDTFFNSMDLEYNNANVTPTWDDQYGNGSGLSDLDVRFDVNPPIDYTWVSLLTAN